MKIAILQCADSGPLESLVIMLSAVGYRCVLPSEALRDELRRMGCDTVLSPADLMRSMGYDAPMRLPEAGIADMAKSDVLYVDVKGHRNGPIVWRRWPQLEKRTLWYRINGARPECVPGCGDEVNPPCPVLTPNQWYQEPAFLQAEYIRTEGSVATMRMPGWAGRAYCCWPPFYRFDEYKRHSKPYFDAPICLIHNLAGWGYGALVNNMRNFDVRCYGRGSPDGLLPHSKVNELLQSALCMVHLKSNDAPGYAIYESMASACPIVCTRRLIWRCKMQDLLIPGKTCLVFDRETHDGLTPEDVAECTREVKEHLIRLADVNENRRIGENGRKRLQQVMWSENNAVDVDSLRAFMERNF